MDNSCRIKTSPSSNSKKIGTFLFAPSTRPTLLLWVLICEVFVGTMGVVVAAGQSKSGADDSRNGHRHSPLEDDEFAEFEDFDEPANVKRDQTPKLNKPGPTVSPPLGPDKSIVHEDKNSKISSRNEVDDLEGVVEDELDDEFEDIEQSSDSSKIKHFNKKKSFDEEFKPLKFTDVPAHLRSNWSNFQTELLMILGLIIYMANYVVGKAKNHKLATAWFETHRDILRSNFDVVGDDGTTQEIQKNILMKESDNCYTLWCSGRQNCQGALFQLRFLKRQDVVATVLQLFKPQNDKIIVRFCLTNDDMDSCVFALGNKKTVPKLVKETTDLGQFCTEKKNCSQLGLPDNFVLYAEILDATSAILDSKTLSIIEKYADLIDYIHVSDQYSGLKSTDSEPQVKLPDTSRVVIFCFNVAGKLNASEKSIEECKPLLNFAFYCLDKIKRFRLSREAKQKCDKNRSTAQETYLKQTHTQRQEAAQLRREEKARERKERVLAEEDPEKQRRLERIEQKREAKKKQPRVKQLKIKAG